MSARTHALLAEPCWAFEPFLEARYQQALDAFRRMGPPTAASLSRVIEEIHGHDAIRGAHAGRVATLAALVAVELAQPADVVRRAAWAGALHELGLALLPASARGDAMPEESMLAAAYRLHPDSARDLVDLVPALAEIGPLLAATCERFDGSGFPNALRGPSIPVEARIVAVANAFDAITQGDESLHLHVRALTHVVAEAGEAFDPAVVRALLGVFDPDDRSPH